MSLNVRDSTDREPAEAEQNIFRTLFESSPGLFLVLAPRDYEIVAVSDAFCSWKTMTWTPRRSIERFGSCT